MRVVVVETAVVNVVLGVARHSPDAETWKGKRHRRTPQKFAVFIIQQACSCWGIDLNYWSREWIVRGLWVIAGPEYGGPKSGFAHM